MVRALGPIPDRLAALGIAVTGLAWSLGNLAAYWPAVEAAGLPLLQSALLILLGGIAAAVAVWFGIGAVIWAMVRALRGQLGFIRALLAVSAATPPMWLATPAAAFLLVDEPRGALGVALIVVVSAGGMLFMMQLVAGLRCAAVLSTGRAWMSVVLAAIFIASFLSLQI